MDRDAIFNELIERSRMLDETAAKIQATDFVESRSGSYVRNPFGLAPTEIVRLVDDYHRWFAACIQQLPMDLAQKFRAEYEGVLPTAPKIQSFLGAPTLTHGGYGSESSWISYWKHPYATTFHTPLLAQRQLLYEAQHRMPAALPASSNAPDSGLINSGHMQNVQTGSGTQTTIGDIHSGHDTIINSGPYESFRRELRIEVSTRQIMTHYPHNFYAEILSIQVRNRGTHPVFIEGFALRFKEGDTVKLIGIAPARKDSLNAHLAKTGPDRIDPNQAVVFEFRLAELGYVLKDLRVTGSPVEVIVSDQSGDKTHENLPTHVRASLAQRAAAGASAYTPINKPHVWIIPSSQEWG